MKLWLVGHQEGVLLRLLLAFTLSGAVSTALSPEARWGQAGVVINDVVFVQGGKTDPFNSYSYTSAPNTNDLLSLPLSQSFDASNPPWILLSNPIDTSTSQGPALSWHTLSAFNDSGVLLFGGQPGPNSPIVVVDLPDSAVLLNVFNLSQPLWFPQAPSWAGQPVRRIYHSSATSPSGIVFIIGGEKADGSGNAFADHYAFDPQAQVFTQLPTENGPPALYGHASVMLTDGRLLVFGGASQGSLIALSTVWVLDTLQASLSWTMLQVDTSALPAPRRAFAAVSVGQGKILLQGGSDASLQNNFDDGWVLDTSKNPAVWSQLQELSQIGARRDHLAVYCNGLVIFVFGYLNSGPAPAALSIFDLSSNSFISSFTPPPPTASVTQTIPGQTGTSTGKATPHPGSPTASDGPGQTSDPGDVGRDSKDKKPVAAIALGTTFGVLGAVAAGIFVFIYSRRVQRKRNGQSFLVIGDDEDGRNSSLRAGSAIPAATMYSVHGPVSINNRWGNVLLGAAFGIAETIGAAARSRNLHQRRDMLADEDTRDFGEWYNARRRDGTGDSSWSLKSILGNRFRSREPSTHSHGSGSHRRERTDPFSDATSLMMYDQESELQGYEVNGRPKSRRQASGLSISSYSYLDPFADPVHERDKSNTNDYEPKVIVNASSRTPPPITTVRMVLPALTSGSPLSPLLEHTSKSSLPSTNISAPSHPDSSETPVESTTSHSTLPTTLEPSPSHITNKSSGEVPKSPRLLSTSLIPASVMSPNIRRSDSWWSKFYRSSFLDRASAPRPSMMPEIRDPNPPPALDPIHEGHPRSSSDDTSLRAAEVGEGLLGSNSTVYAADPGRSLTSLQTADTERIERMAGAMDIVQRVRSRSQRTTGSISSGLSVDTHGSNFDGMGQVPNPSSVAILPHKDDTSGTTIPLASPLSSPTRRQKSFIGRSQSPTLPVTQDTPLSPNTKSSVAARIQMYERRLSQDQEQPPPTNTWKREERSPKKNRVSVDYGFVPRPNLFVANPDNRNSRSSDS